MCAGARGLLRVLTSQERGKPIPAAFIHHSANQTYVLIMQETRIKTLQHAYRKAVAAHPREDMPKAESIRNLGLLDKEEDRYKSLSRPTEKK